MAIINSDPTSGKKELELMNKHDHVPVAIKEEFNLPKEMKDNEVNFAEVRKRDLSQSIKSPVWSGQEVLQVSMNMQ